MLKKDEIVKSFFPVYFCGVHNSFRLLRSSSDDRILWIRSGIEIMWLIEHVANGGQLLHEFRVSEFLVRSVQFRVTSVQNNRGSGHRLNNGTGVIFGMINFFQMACYYQ